MKAIQHINTLRSAIHLNKWLLLVLLGISSTTFAKDYMVEVLLFENQSPAQATESHDYVPPQSMRSGSDTWVLEPSMLLEEAKSLDDSEEYYLRHYYSWGQESLPYPESATYTVLETEAQGYIKIYADQLLFANIDLDYKGFRMKENRRLKLNEKHFFDHPKFGLLLQVSRLEVEEEEEQQPEGQPEEQIDESVTLESAK